MKIIRSNKGHLKIIHDDYLYVKHKFCKDTIRWKCFRSSSRKCKAILKTNLGIENPETIHTHSCEKVDISAVTHYQALKYKARRTGSTIDEDDLKSLPKESKETILRTLRNHKNKRNATTRKETSPGRCLINICIFTTFFILLFMIQPCTK